jgi:hypothetical protein
MILLLGCQDRPKREKVGEAPMGYRGEARLNPYLGAQRYLEAKGWSVESSRTWSNYDSETSVIFMPGSFLQTKGMAMRVLEWVQEGGTLVLTIQGGEPGRNDFTSPSSGPVAGKGDFTGLDDVFELFGVEVASQVNPAKEVDQVTEDGHLAREWEVSRTTREFGGLALEFEGRTVLRIEDGVPWVPEAGGGSRVVEGGYGLGSVIFLAHARPLRSPYLARADHAHFLEFLAGRSGPGELVFLYGSTTSFFGLLWKEGRMVVIAGLCALVAWLWMRIPRFGPILRDREVKPQKYGESLTTSARFLWRVGKIAALIRPLRERIEQQSEGDPESLYDRLAGESGMSRDEVKETLTAEPPRDPGQTLRLVERLQLLLRR